MMKDRKGGVTVGERNGGEGKSIENGKVATDCAVL